MSKFIPDPQIQSLRAMRAGDISMPAPVAMDVGVGHAAIAQPIVQLSKSLSTVESVGSPVATPSESPVMSRTFETRLSVDTAQSKSLSAIESFEALSGTPSESLVVGVGFSTSVI